MLPFLYPNYFFFAFLPEPIKANKAASQIAEDAALASREIALSMDKLWEDVLNGGLYTSITQLGLFFAVGTLLIFMVQWAKALIDGEDSRAMSELIWPLIVVVLLANEGALLRSGTYGMREVINVVNQRILTSTSGTIALQEAYEKARTNEDTKTLVQDILSQCQQKADLQQREQCIQDEVQKVKGLPQEPSNSWESFLQGLEQTAQFLNTNPFEVAVRGLLTAFSIAFQWIVEICLLLTALLGPLAVGGSLLPVGQKAIFAWATGFYSVGMMKLSFNIIVGLVSTMVLNADANDPLIFAFAVGLLAPILSVAIAAGGGLAVFNSFSSIAKAGLGI